MGMWKELCVFPVPVGPEMDIPTGVPRYSYTLFVTQLTTAAYCSDTTERRISDRGDFSFRRATSGSGLGAPSELSTCISALTITLERYSRDCDRRTVLLGSGRVTTSGRPISASGGVVPDTRGAARTAGVTCSLGVV